MKQVNFRKIKTFFVKNVLTIGIIITLCIIGYFYFIRNTISQWVIFNQTPYLIESFDCSDNVTHMGTSKQIRGEYPTTIEPRSFDGCYSLEELAIPDTVTEIGENAFSNCKHLAVVKLSDNLEVIKNSAFLGCINLKSIIIPSSVTKIGAYAFAACGLESIEFLAHSKLTTIEPGAFKDSRLKMIINLPSTIDTRMFPGVTFEYRPSSEPEYHFKKLVLPKEKIQGPGMFTEQGPGMFTEQGPGMFTEQVPGTFTEQVPGIFTEQDPRTSSTNLLTVPFYAEKYPGMFTEQVPGMFTEQVPGMFTEQVPGMFTEQVPGMFSASLMTKTIDQPGAKQDFMYYNPKRLCEPDIITNACPNTLMIKEKCRGVFTKEQYNRLHRKIKIGVKQIDNLAFHPPCPIAKY